MKEEQDGDDEEDWEWVPPSKNRASSEDENPSEDGEDANAELEDRDVLNIKVDEAMDAAVWMTQSEDNAEEDYARHRRKREASWTWESGLVERESKLIRAIPGELLTLEEVKACLEANGGENIVSVTGEESGMREDSVIVTGRSSQHILRLAKILHKSMRKRGLRSSHENKPYDADENWVVLDAGSILVHVFTQEGRDFMKLDDKLLPDRRDEQMEEHKQDMFERNTEDRAKRRRRSKRKRMPYDEEDAM
ncbi:Ribosomal silencing factor RsfS [Hondaea fermentalgiana]|uniref:Ribosomal silencing factor RsfS n=1 Tax=Hondaea fermentalgiana TaxID=2315210 RepID=A0A2R5GCL1_9STRA|nr:Ribosomal silencing factor RsfS [Hondaea fermentalgiana]|eukprot:GBG25504.1 Ribosomal silencing factor RsfS [Hondaea fermentalgiana]